jgi:hypothetical protein
MGFTVQTNAENNMTNHRNRAELILTISAFVICIIAELTTKTGKS